MATTTSDGPKDDTAPPFTEHDKLGRLGRSAVLDQPVELRRALVGELAQAAESAKAAAARVDQDPTHAVHAYRKALRRARGILSLLAGALPRSERNAVRDALQDARRALGAARDHAVAPETLEKLALGDEDREVARRVVSHGEEARPPLAEVKQLLAEGAARAAAQVEAVEAALPEELEWECVLDGVRDVYDEARAARKAGKNSKRAFHRWRRRSKELSAQLEVLASYAGSRVGEIYAEIDNATDSSREAVDLLMSRDYVRTFGQGVEEHLLAAIEAQLEDEIEASRAASKEAFRRKPSRFAKRLDKAVRRDLAPVEDEPSGD